MRTISLRCQRIRLLVILGAVLVSSAALANPPPPRKVVRDIRSFFHRVADGVKGASKKTWGAIRERFTPDEEEERNVRSRRPDSRSNIPPQDQSFARSKEAVPYRYDDAESFEANSSGERDTAKEGPFTSPGEQGGSGPSEKRKSSENRPESEQAQSQSRPAPLPESTPSSTRTDATGGDDQIEFARPVPGKSGLVYPPGAPAAPENMVDVAGFLNGQIVRDPRTGKLFRVP